MGYRNNVIDIFQGHYKDSTGGTTDYRSLPSLYMLMRIGLVFEFAAVNTFEYTLKIGPGIIHVFLGTFHFIAKPYMDE